MSGGALRVTEAASVGFACSTKTNMYSNLYTCCAKGAQTVGTVGRKSVEMADKLDLRKLIELLNTAFADEWLAYYQYWIGVKVVLGPMRGQLVAGLKEHAADELRHAAMCWPKGSFS